MSELNADVPNVTDLKEDPPDRLFYDKIWNDTGYF